MVENKDNNIKTTNCVTLRDYVDTRFIAIQLAVDKAEQIINARLLLMNEFREALKDASTTYFTRAEHELYMKSMQVERDNIKSEIDSLKLSRAELSGKASAKSVFATVIISAVAIFLSVTSLIVGIIHLLK